MAKTVNRVPASFNLPAKNEQYYDRYFNHTSFKGLADTSNILAVDQETFADCKNVYVDDNNLLSSRPTIKHTGDENIYNAWTFNEIMLVLYNDGVLKAYNKNKELIASTAYSITTNFKINCLEAEDKIYIYTNLLKNGEPAFWCFNRNTNKFEDAIKYIYTPITKLVTNNIDDDFETKNFLTSAEKTRFLYSTTSYVDFARLLNQKVEVNIDGKSYTINEWQEDNEKVLVNEYSYLNKNEQIVDIKEVGDITILLKYNSNTKNMSVSFNGTIFYNLPDLSNLISMPQLSEDGLYVFAFTEQNLQRCKIANDADSIYKAQSSFVWESIKYLERDDLNVSFNKSYNNVAFGNFKSKDIYSYIITPDSNISLSTGLNSCILYAQWSQGIKELYTTEILNVAINNFNTHKMKLFVDNIPVTLPTSQVSPTIIGIIVDRYTAKALNFNEDVTGLGILFLQEKTSTSNDIYNGDTVYIDAAEFSVGQSVDDISGYLSNPTKVTNSTLYGFKLQRWTVNGTSAVKDKTKSVISNNDYVSLEPVVTKMNTKVITNTSLEIGYLDTENAKLVAEYLSGSGAKINNLYLKNDTTNKIGNISLPEEFTITDTFTYDDYGSIFYNGMEMGYYNTNMNQITLYYLPVRLGLTVSGTTIYDYNGNITGSINTSNKAITVNIKYISNNGNVYINQTFNSDDSVIGSITSNTITISPDYLKMVYTYSENTIINSSNITVGSFNTTKQITINDRMYTYDLSNNTIYSGSVEAGTIVKNGDTYTISIKYGINLSAGLSAGILYNLSDATVVGNINGIKGTLTFDNISYYLSGGALGRYITVPLTVDGSVYRYLAPFRNILGFTQALHKVNISTTSLTNKTQITLVDQSGNNENISGIINKNLSTANVIYKKAIQINYYPDGEKQLNYEQLKNYISVYDTTNYMPDFDIKFANQEFKVEDNYEIITYNIKLCSSIKYTDGTDQDRYVTGYLDKTYVANVLNTFNVDWKSDNSAVLPDYATTFEIMYDSKILEVNNSNFSNKYLINNDTILTNKYLYVNNNIMPYITVRNVKPILNSNYIYYSYNNILYSNKLPDEKQITLDIESDKVYSQKVFDNKTVLNEYFLSFDNLLEISSVRRSGGEENNLLLYFPQLNELKYNGRINAVHPLSSSEVGVFLNNEIWLVKSLGIDDEGIEIWQNTKSKLNVGIKEGSNVITSIDGASVIFSIPRGITHLSYQNFVQSTDQTLTFISDNIENTYEQVRENALKFIYHKYWIIAYASDLKIMLLFDTRSSTWWKWEYNKNINKILVFNNIVYILSNNNLYKFVFDDQNYYDDTDIIDWSFTSQKLHLNNINKYKMINNIQAIAHGKNKQYCKLTTKAYRNLGNPAYDDVIVFDINDLRTFVKTIRLLKVQQFQYTFATDKQSIEQHPLKLNSITIKYQYKGDVK